MVISELTSQDQFEQTLANFKPTNIEVTTDLAHKILGFYSNIHIPVEGLNRQLEYVLAQQFPNNPSIIVSIWTAES
jgi:hypothetical protein